MKPNAVMRVRDDGFAEICAWCSDKADAERWAVALGYQPSHGICDACKTKLCTEVVFEAGVKRCVAPTSEFHGGSTARGTASDVPPRPVVFSCRLERRVS